MKQETKLQIPDAVWDKLVALQGIFLTGDYQKYNDEIDLATAELESNHDCKLSEDKGCWVCEFIWRLRSLKKDLRK